jgi:hypothetical protein
VLVNYLVSTKKFYGFDSCAFIAAISA